MSYTVMISEGQRKLIVDALKKCEGLDEEHRLSYADDDLEQSNCILLVQCLNSLPEDERKSPGVLHGLSL